MAICPICKSNIVGRTDKKFCSIACKNFYHTNLRRVTDIAVQKIDTILHRNRSILLEILGKHAIQTKVARLILDQKKFNFKYHTHSYVNSVGKTYRYVYDFSWMEFSDDEILILRRK